MTAGTAVAQKAHRHTCGTTQYMDAMIQKDPSILNVLSQLETITQDFADANVTQNADGKTVVTIPTVVHVVYRTSAENISAARIQSQIDVLNEDFGRLNSDTVNTPSVFSPLGADTEIRFALAVRDPDGFASTGITRTQTNTSSFGVNNNIKRFSTGGADAWDRDQYLNIWIGNLGSFLLGYAQFPGLSAAFDGVVLHYRFTGDIGAQAPFNKGRTGTHEVGHWLNLRHIWGDATCGNDFVNDTPTQQDENYGCPNFPVTSSCTGNPPNGDMFMNYMDYTDDACMNIFTEDQKTRMQAIINSVRAPLQVSPGLTPPVTGISEFALDAKVNMFPNPSSGEVRFAFDIESEEYVELVLINVLGETLLSSNYRVGNGNGIDIDLSDQTAGLYIVQMKLNDGIVTKRLTISR